MKTLLMIIACFVALTATAEIKQINMQASGLTCSMCSNAIYKKLQKIDFIQDVSSNIKESTYTMTFKEGSNVDFDVIRKAVEDAGFSVAKMSVIANFNNVKVSNDAHINLAGHTLHFLNVGQKTLNGDQTIQLVDKKFVTDKVYKKYASSTKMECVKTGFMESCCTKDNKSTSNRIYHVTI